MSTIQIVILLLGGAVISAALVYIVRLLAPRFGLLDVPNQRSLHSRPTSRGGGAPIVIVSLLGLGAAGFLGVRASWAEDVGYLAGACLIAGVSFVDDVRPLPSGLRFAVQAMGASAMVAGLSAHAAPLNELGPGIAIWIVVVVAIVWSIGVTNAYNFMDGIDGMAALQGVIGGLAWAAIAFMDQREWLGVLSLLVAGGTLGFSYHNWHPARIFMGDVGSAFLGFTFAFIALAMPHTAYQLGSGVLVLWPLLFDTGFTLIRRLREGQNIFQAHRSHLYQRLVLGGWGQRRVALLYGTLTATTSVLAIVWWFADSPFAQILIVAVVLGITYGLVRLVTATDLKHSEAGVRVH